MAYLYLDEDIPIEVASLLTSAGHPTRTTVGVGRVGRWDAEQLWYATEQGWTIVTHNRRDFRALHEGWLTWSPQWREPRPHGGILSLDKGNRLAASDYAAAILILLSTNGVLLENHAFEWFARNGGEWVAWRPMVQPST